MNLFITLCVILLAFCFRQRFAATTIESDTDTCFFSGNNIRVQFAFEGLDIPEPGDNFVVTVQTINADTGAPIEGVPAQIFNGAAAVGNIPSLIVGTQAAEINRIAGFLDFAQGNAANKGLTCQGGKNNVGFNPISYVENGTPVQITNAGTIVGGGGGNGAVQTTLPPNNAPVVTCPAKTTPAPTTPAPTTAIILNQGTVGCPASPATGSPATGSPATTAPAAPAVGTGANFNQQAVTITYSGQCSGNNAINLLVSSSKGGEAFKPDAAGFGVPCDEYFEISFSFIDANGNPVNLPLTANGFFNAKKLQTDGKGNVFAQFTPEIDAFGNGFLTLSNGLSCTNGTPNFKIRTNYLLTALNDGTYNRMLNEVTDAGTFGSGNTIAAPPNNSGTFQLGQPMCNIGANQAIAFGFPAGA